MEERIIDVLMDTLDLIDKGMEATKLAKITILASSPIGDENPITSKDVNSWSRLRDRYLLALQKGQTAYARSIRPRLVAETMKLINRCYTSENEKELRDKLARRWGMQSTECTY